MLVVMVLAVLNADESKIEGIPLDLFSWNKYFPHDKNIYFRENNSFYMNNQVICRKVATQILF